MKKHIKNAILLVLGNYLLALAVGTFILPYNILSGGVAGIAVALEPLLGIDPNLMINGLVLGLFVIGALALGRNFAFSTAFSSILYPFFLTLTITDGSIIINPILASLYGGLLAGIGVGMVIRTGSSTGGMDVPPLVLHKYTHIEISTWVLIVDGITVSIGLWTYGLEAVLIGFISVWSASFAINKVLLFGGQNAKTVYIISEKFDEILDYIHKNLDRGTTLIDAKGGFTGDNRPVILTVILKNQYPELNQGIKEIDEHAFLIVSDATEVSGFGFSFDYKV
jgi:uncharacterized membrane-anchored protein YitT (DUF2179 family)